MAYVIVSIDSANAHDLAEELVQRLLAKQVVKSGTPVLAFEQSALIDIQYLEKEAIDKIIEETSDWIKYKHSTLKKRVASGTRQKQNLGMPTESSEELVCIEIKR